ncbi:oleate hydratase [Staphylococcus aureus]
MLRQVKKLPRNINSPDMAKAESIKLTVDDLVFVTNGSITESSTYGDNDTPAPPTDELGGSWTLWKNLARQSPNLES